MRTNGVKRRIREGGLALGTMVMEFATPGISQLAAAAGAEFILFDLEHTGWGMDTARMLLATARGVDIVPIVRVPATEYHFMARALDTGAMGLMVPMVESAEQAGRIVQAAKYPPIGRRGAAFGVAHDDYRGTDTLETMRSANEETLLIAQIETARGLENLDAIGSVREIDVLWIGHYDLTNSLGIPGQFEHPRYHEAVARVLDACRRHGKAAGFMAGTAAQGQALVSQGFRIIAQGRDAALYQDSLRQGIEASRSALRR